MGIADILRIQNVANNAVLSTAAYGMHNIPTKAGSAFKIPSGDWTPA